MGEHGAICRLGVFYDGSFFSYAQHYYYHERKVGWLRFPELHHFLEKYVGLREQGFASYKVVYAAWHQGLFTTKDATAEDVHGVVQQVDREATLQQDPGDPVHVAHHHRARLASRDDDPGRPRVAQHRAARRQDPRAEPRLPIAVPGRGVDLTEDDVDHPVEDVLLVRDVVVEGHRLDADLRAEPPHAERLDPVPVRELHGSPEHPLTGKRGSALGRRLRLGRHAGTVLNTA